MNASAIDIPDSHSPAKIVTMNTFAGKDSHDNLEAYATSTFNALGKAAREGIPGTNGKIEVLGKHELEFHIDVFKL